MAVVATADEAERELGAEPRRWIASKAATGPAALGED